ncbi:MAG: YebC/PmpR family DNA-binding transcriptional regulator [Waddliaceae bacterium]|nr:YebC/PmpR family DNA-binding transcriptional regulator [Waddliaceae bacterium]
MAGHSKWANIKHKKGKADAKKGKVFSRVAKEIISAVKVSGPDPKANPRLRLALQKARAANMPNDNVERNIKKASSDDQASYDEVTYELYGHGGVGIIVDAMTDNRNRLASEIRIATNKRGGSQAAQGAVSFNFDRRGVITISKDKAIEDELFLHASEAGAEDFDSTDEAFLVITEPTQLYQVKEEIEKLGFEADDAALVMIPKVTVDCDEETAKSNLALIEWLEEIEDVDEVFHNMSDEE